MKRFCSMGALLLLCSADALAQYTNILDGGTNVIVNTAWTNDSVWIGETTSSNALFVVSGGAISSSNVYVGASTNADDNTVAVTGGRWDIEQALTIGPGTNNVVTVSEGGILSVGSLVIQSNNNVYLNSEGTLAISTNFDASLIGFNWNQGGTLSVAGTLSGMAVSSNSVVLDDGRSLILNGGTWNAAATNLVLNDSDLVVTNGGWVNVGTGTTNDYAMGPDGGISVGGTNGAAVLIENDASAQTTGGLYIGGTSSGLTGMVTVTNGGMIEAQALIIGNDGSALNIDDGGMLSMAGDYDADLQTNVNWNGGGTIAVGGTLTKSNGLDGVNRTLVLDGGTWNPGGTLAVSGSSNTLSVADGGTVTSADGLVGSGSSNLNNRIDVYGDGSAWLTTGDLYIGSTNGSTGNAVSVSTGGRIETDDLIIAAGNSFYLNNNGTLAIAGDFNVAQQSNMIWNSGGMLSLNGSLSGLSTASLVADGETNDYAYIDGGHGIELDGGSLALGTTNLIVGYQSSNNELIMTNGATTVNADGYIGWGGSAANNSVLVSGSGTTWTNRGGDLYVGAWWSGTNLANTGSGNALIVENDAWVNVGEVQTNLAGGSMLVASTNGAQLIAGRGSVDIEGTLYLGLSTNLTGSAIIRNGGSVSVGDLQLADGSLLDLQAGGAFAIASDFDASADGFVWNESSHLSVGGILTGMPVMGSTNYLDGGRDLTLDGGSWDLAGNGLVVGLSDSDSSLTVRNGGQLSSGNAYIGWGTNAADNEVEVSDDGLWSSTGSLWVGHDGSGHALSVLSGGLVTNDGNAYIGNTDASGNSVSINGSNSVWGIGGDLVIGGVSNSVNNSLSVTDQGWVNVGGTLTLQSGNIIALDTDGAISVGSDMNVLSNSVISGTGSIRFGETNASLSFFGDFITLSTGIVFSANSNYINEVSVVDGTFTVAGSNGLPYVNFQTLSMSNSTLNGTGVLDTFNTLNMSGGTIDPAGDAVGRLELSGLVSLDGTTYRAQVISNQWDELVFSGTNQVDLAAMSAELFVPYLPTTSNDIVVLSGTDLANSFNATNLDVRPLLYDGELLVTNNEVQVVFVPVDAGTLSSTLGYASLESVRAGFNGMKNMVFTRTKQLRRNLVATAHAIPNEVLLLTTTNTPAGAMGPGEQNTIFDMHIWLQHYSGQGDYDGAGVSDAFEMSNNGTTIGADRMIGEALAVGFNYTYARSGARAFNGDVADTETYWIGTYGEWVGVDGLYVDAIAAYGFSNFDTERYADNYRGTATYHGHAFGGAVDLGQYYYYGDNVALSPYIGLHALALKNAAYNEVEDAGSVIGVEEVNHGWLESALGLKLRHRFDTPLGRFQTTGYGEWLYDFLQKDIASSLVSGSLPPVNTARIVPDESSLNAGIGFSWISTEYMEIGIGYNGRFSDSFEEHSASAMLDIMF